MKFFVTLMKSLAFVDQVLTFRHYFCVNLKKISVLWTLFNLINSKRHFYPVLF